MMFVCLFLFVRPDRFSSFLCVKVFELFISINEILLIHLESSTNA